MEHLLLPEHPTDSDVDVPYICENEYDDLPWSDYPKRRQKPWMAPGAELDGYLPYETYDHLHPTSTSEQEKFYQEWLFFGLLKVLLGPVFKAAEFIRYENGCSLVTTQCLIPRMEEALSLHFSERSDTELTGRMNKISQCIKHTNRILRVTNSDFNWRIKFSITSTCEMFTLAFRSALMLRSSSLTHMFDYLGSWPKELSSEGQEAEMIKHGWCVGDASRLSNRFYGLSTLYFFRRLRRVDGHPHHDNCTRRTCVWNQIIPSEYKTKHVQDNCLCKPLEGLQGNSLDIEAVLQRGKIPLLRICGDLDHHWIEVIEATPNTQYVAISHVWAGGLGNPSANSLPVCQVLRLRDIIEEIHVRSITIPPFATSPEQKDMNDQELLLWIDTLCCPVKPMKLKHKSLELMRSTYEKATHVVVLDASLEAYDVSQMSKVEQFARILSSSWLQRLWTLQEGKFAKRLWFRFKNTSIDVETLLRDFARVCEGDIRHRVLYLDFVAFWHYIKKPLGEIKSHDDTVGAILRALDSSLKDRNVSVPEDEAICISNLLNLPVSDVMAVVPSVEARMSKVWELIAEKFRGLPQDMLFLEQPRLDTLGWRWAPRTLLDPYGNSREHACLWTGSELGQPTDKGFRAEWPGILLSRRSDRSESASVSDGLLKNPWPWFKPKKQESLLFQHDDGEWYRIFQIRKKEKSVQGKAVEDLYLQRMVDQGNCALIVSKRLYLNTESRRSRAALLGHITGSEHGTLDFAVTDRLIFRSVTPQDRRIIVATKKLAEELWKDHTTQRIVDTMQTQTGHEYQEAFTALEKRITARVTDELKDKDLLVTLKEVSVKYDPVTNLRNLVTCWFFGDNVGEQVPPRGNIPGIPSFSKLQKWLVDRA